MATTTITGTINGVNNTALANKWITFRLVQLGTDSVATATVAQSVDSVQTDANGDFSIDVWNNGDSGKTSVLEITIDGSKAESVIIPTGTASIELWDLIENYQADGSTSEQVPVVSDLFLRKSSNLSDIGNKLIASQNLDLEVGVDVQAHSAVLDATTASFLLADEAKLDGIEALAEVNNPTTVLDADIGSTVQAHSAILDATTASFTTAKDAAISTNTANISSNDTDIGVLTGSVVQNQADIATNVTDIANNVTNIATNALNIASNDIDIANNVTNIATNATNISNAEGAILGNTISINDITAGLAQSTVIVQQASDLSGTLLSNVVYFIDGIIDMGSQSIEVPAGGLSLIGSTFDVSQLISTAVGYTMFTSPVGGSGNLLGKDLSFETSSPLSQVFDLESATGFDAFEFARINFNNCTSLGTVDNYRQGLEEGSGRFGGTPTLTLKGAWAGGYRVTTSIVRSLDAGMTTPLFSAGVGFSMASRFLTDINCDLPASAALLDFTPAQFPNPSTLQLQGAIITRNGVSNASDTNITPNVAATDLCSAWRDNTGLKNTFVGGENNLSTPVATTFSGASVPNTIVGTWTASELVHFDSPVTGQLRHTGKDPKEFRVTFDFYMSGGSGDELEIILVKNLTSSPVYSQKRVVNNLQGGTDVAFFNGTTYVNLDQNDLVFWMVQNNTDTSPVVLLTDSQFNVETR